MTRAVVLGSVALRVTAVLVITLLRTTPALAAGVTLSPTQVSGNQCFTLGVDPQGTGQITGYAGPQGGPSSTSAPSTTAPSAAPSTLPSTTTTQPQTGTLDLTFLWLVLALAAV